ncbi:MAG TPA: hypothetical protein VNH18_19060 [Bryobacteraceae bacterium]|nr:hypothetical protein [Bryobacteraceae bacterium]
MLTRYPDWQSRLERFISAHRADTFAYGRWDCCLFVCSAIEAMTGTDIAARFRGKYTSRRGAMAAVREVTGRASVRSVAEDAAMQFEMPTIPVRQAKRGDMALIQRGGGPSLGLVSLNGRDVLVVGEGGLVAVPISLALGAWGV